MKPPRGVFTMRCCVDLLYHPKRSFTPSKGGSIGHTSSDPIRRILGFSRPDVARLAHQETAEPLRELLALHGRRVEAGAQEIRVRRAVDEIRAPESGRREVGLAEVLEAGRVDVAGERRG